MIELIIIFIFVLIVVITCILVYFNKNEVKPKKVSIPIPTPLVPNLPPIDEDLNPMIVIPGLGGTNLDYSIDENFTSCNIETINELKKIQPGLWISPLGLLLQKNCYLNMVKPVYDEDEQTLKNLPGLKVFPRENYFGDPLSSICLSYLFNSTTKCFPLTDYSKNFVNYFTGKGYTPGYNLFIPGYDFRLVPYKEYADEYFDTLKELIEKTYETTGKKIHLIGHSLGTMLGNMFLNKMSKKWKKCYITDFISISPSYDGAPKSLRSALSGYNFGLPDAINVGDLDFVYPERNMAGVAATIPLFPEMYGAIDCDTNNDYSGNGEAIVLLFDNKEKSYNVNNYKDGIFGLIRDIIRDVNRYTGNTDNTKYLDSLIDIMMPIAKEKKKYAYSDPKVKVYQIIVQPVSTECSYLYDASKGFTEGPIFTVKVVGDEDIPVYGTKIPEIYKWKNVTNKIFPPINNLDHYYAYADSTIVYDYIYDIVKNKK